MRITVLGAGSWGTALACLLARNGHQVKLWNRTEEKAAQLRHDRENKLFLPGIELPAEMEIGSGYEMTSGIDYLIFAVPSNAVPESSVLYNAVSTVSIYLPFFVTWNIRLANIARPIVAQVSE